LGVLFQCVDTACLLAAVISATRRPFVCPPGKRKESLAYQRGFDPASDLLAVYAAAEAFEAKLQGASGFGNDMENADQYAASRFLVPQRLRQLLRTRDSLREELVRARLIDKSSSHKNWAAQMWAYETGVEPAEGEGGAKQEEGAAEGGEKNGEAAAGNAEDDGDVGGWGAWEEDAGGAEADWGYWGSSWWHEWKQWQDPNWLALHAHDDEPEMRKALLVAASPVNVAMRRRPFLAKHRTPTGLEAIIAPQSVNAQPRGNKGAGKGEVDRRGGPSWWAYGNMQISNKQGFLRTTTLVDPYHIMLFGGLGVEHRKDVEKYEEEMPEEGEDVAELATEGLEPLAPVSMIDEWIEPQGSEDTIWLLSALRAEIRRCIHLKVLDPTGWLPETSQWLLDEIATSVIRTSTRRQGRVLSILPQQMVLPPGGSVPSTIHKGKGDFKGKGKDGKGKGGARGKGAGPGRDSGERGSAERGGRVERGAVGGDRSGIGGRGKGERRGMGGGSAEWPPTRDVAQVALSAFQ